MVFLIVFSLLSTIGTKYDFYHHENMSLYIFVIISPSSGCIFCNKLSLDFLWCQQCHCVCQFKLSLSYLKLGPVYVVLHYQNERVWEHQTLVILILESLLWAMTFLPAGCQKTFVQSETVVNGDTRSGHTVNKCTLTSTHVWNAPDMTSFLWVMWKPLQYLCKYR